MTSLQGSFRDCSLCVCVVLACVCVSVDRVCVFGRPVFIGTTEGWSEIMLMAANYDLGDQLFCQFICLIKPSLF